ncbi:MAG TPA: endonuclease [Rikenellaceae bacterium]|nr:endonuclease [Rikenellaceae bacterium]
MKRMLIILSVILLFPTAIITHKVHICFSIPGNVGGEDQMLVMFWNLENLFDWKRDSLNGSESEAEFTSRGNKHWTRRRFVAKCNAIAKSIFWIKDSEGMLPDVIGIAEVENRFVLERLLEDTSLYKTDYEIVHFDSPDPRGIDVALLYRASRLRLLGAVPLRVGGGTDSPIRTRDILLTKFRKPDGDSVAFLVNHHPSKYGGKTGDRREVALRRLREATDSLQRSRFRNIVAMGDFNDTPENPAFGILTDRKPYSLTNLAAPLASKGEGTIRYSGKWEMIDMFFASESLVMSGHIHEMKVLRLPFLMTRDNAHSGEKPLRTYTGPRYVGGVSDHCPIVVRIL